MELEKYIRDVPDFPKPGIVFKDITPLLNDPAAFKHAIDLFVEYQRNSGIKIDRIAGIESRGFIFASAVSFALGVGLVLIRKAGKLPHHTHSHTYDLEYGTDTLEIHKDAIKPGEKVLILDDLLATGGTLAATCELIERIEGEVAGIGVLVELEFLGGRAKLGSRPFHSFIKY